MDENLVLTLTIRKSESSMDSHSDTYSLKITGRDVDFHSEHRGFPDRMEKNEKYTMSTNAYKNLISFIKKNRLNRNLEESKPDAKRGLSVSMQMEITMDGIVTRSSISGAYNDWTMRKKDMKPSNLVNIDYYRNADRIISNIINRMEYY